MTSRLLIVICAAMAFCLSAYAQPVDGRLEEINTEVETTLVRLSDIARRAAAARKELEAQEGRIAELRNQEAAISSELSEIGRKKTVVSHEIGALQENLDTLGRSSSARLRVAYMVRPGQAFARVMALPDSSGFARRAFLFSRVRTYDISLLNSISADVREREEKQSEMEELLERQQILRDDVARQREEIGVQVGAHQKLMRSLDDEKKKKEEVLTALRAQALRLETVVVSLTGGEGRIEKSVPARKVAGQGEQKESEDLGSFAGPGLTDSAKGSRPEMPIEGEVVQRFGKQKLGEFEDMVFHKGVEFSSTPGAVVSAIADGQVMFVGRMPGYGNLLILDHGKRYYSLYGRLAEIKAERASVVKKGGVLGSTGTLDERGRNFYFEIRKEGTSVNPETFFGARFK